MNAHFHQLVKVAAMLLLLLGATTRVQAQSALDGFDPNPNGSILVVVVQPDGKILIGGDFTTLSPNGGAAVTRNHIARLNPDGALDTVFDPNSDNTVFSIAVQADGKILTGGNFTTIGGQPRNYMARLNATTGLADSFNPNAINPFAPAWVGSIAVQPDGKILASGNFTTIGGQPRSSIARLDATTGLADSFDPNPNSFVYSIAVQADGSILVGGAFNQIGQRTRNHIARLDAATGAADTFDPNANGVVYSIAVQADGKILAGGAFSGVNSIGGQTRNRMARLDATTGSADSFDPNANGDVDSIALQTDGKILVVGHLTNIGGQTRNHIARLHATTGLADSFNPNANDLVHSIAVQADGKILVGGLFANIGGQARFGIGRLETDGRLDQTLNLDLGGPNDHVTTAAVQPDGKILIGGNFHSMLGVERNNIARLNTDGTLDTAFNPNANSNVDAIAVQTDGKILAGGYFTSIGGQTRNRIARLDATIGLADSFDPNADGIIDTITVQADGKVLVGGGFNTIGEQTRNYIARLDATTGLADSFAPNANGGVYSLALQADGRLLVGGFFNSIGGQVRHSLARLDTTTGLADSFDPNVAGAVFALALQADSKILASGSFNNIGGQPRNHMARLDAASGVPDSFDPNPNAFVRSITVQSDGKILAGGNFTNIGGQPRNYIARLDAASDVPDSFDPNANSTVDSIAVQADGKILASGSFNNIGGQPRNSFARLSNDTAALQNLTARQNTVTWTQNGSSPQFTHVTFAYSTDNLNYMPLGNGTVAGNSWILTGLHLPIRQNIYIRARGYRLTGNQNGSESLTESVQNAFVVPPGTLGNISTRLRVQTGDNALIGGLIVTGTEPKTVIVRAIGPSLSVPGALADPVIEVYGSAGQLFATNDNWRDGKYAKQVAATLPPANDLESALWGRLTPGAYTFVVRGKDDTTGIGLFEVYDLDQSEDSKLANISTRGFVETGDDVMIGGAVILGGTPARVLLRAIGPSLTNFGVPNALPDPTLELHDGNGALLASNDNWRSDQEVEIIATGIPPSNDLESAILRNLTPGNYTAIVGGVNSTTGVALVEAYELN